MLASPAEPAPSPVSTSVSVSRWGGCWFGFDQRAAVQPGCGENQISLQYKECWVLQGPLIGRAGSGTKGTSSVSWRHRIKAVRQRALCQPFLGREADACGQPLLSLAVGWRMLYDNLIDINSACCTQEEPLQ